MDIVKSETFKNFTILNKALLFLVKLKKNCLAISTEKKIKFRKLTSENLKIRKLSVALARNFKFSGVICDEIWLKVNLI